jgi:hypothetical protein
MGYRMKVNLPNRPQGVEISIPGLGAFENGKTYDVTDEQATAFRRARGKMVDDVDAKGNKVGNKLEPCPPLDELSIFGVVVEKTSEKTQGSSKPNDVGPTGNVKVQSGSEESSK